MSTNDARIAELTSQWEEGANYGETEPTHCAEDYALSEEDWAAYLGAEGAAEIVRLIAERDATSSTPTTERLIMSDVIKVTGGHRSDTLPATTVVAEDHTKIAERYVGQPVEYTTSDGVTVRGVVSAVDGLSLVVAL